MPTSVFYEHFDRHDDGEGLKAHSTTYCPGCGHGLVQKYLALAIDELGVQDSTVLVSPVGCAVFSYYYFDTGNTQAAHGRAPAVALGHKMANPGSVVISYQGDGDLASIGLAEIISTAQLGVPITVVFVNNAIYGMTGGQMAPTTLMGQPTSTTPLGRSLFSGEPLKIAEMIGALDGPSYVERVALYDNRRRTHARRAIKKALEVQVVHKGFALVEVLSECPLYLGLDPEDAEHWVRDNMAVVFPLGVTKDNTQQDLPRFPDLAEPSYDADKAMAVLGSSLIATQGLAAVFPEHLDPLDVAVKFAGAGGDGAQTAAMVVTHAAVCAGFDSTHIPSYGPQSRGGTSYADVHVAREQVLSPAAPRPHVLVAFNQPSLTRFGPDVRAGGTIIYDSSVVADGVLEELRQSLASSVRLVGVPLGDIALSLGALVTKNLVALGVLQAVTSLLPSEPLLEAMRKVLGRKPEVLALDEEAFAAGARFVHEQLV